MSTMVDEVAAVFAQIGDAAMMRKFFDEILTARERTDIALRWQLMKMLDERIPQRAIAAKLGVSLCKITRGAKILQRKKSVSAKLLDRQKASPHQEK